MKVRLIQFLVRLLVKLETKEVLLDRVVSVLYPGKLGYLMLASPEEFAGLKKEMEEECTDEELDFLTDPAKEPKKGVLQ